MLDSGRPLKSINPANNQLLWSGVSASKDEVDASVRLAEQVFFEWMSLKFSERFQYVCNFKEQLESNKQQLVEILSQETGKPLWEAKTELAAMLAKVEISKAAYEERTSVVSREIPGAISFTRHKPHGVVAVLGPFNFPGHIPNGHIIPALLAGNTVVFKPSDLTPYFSEKIIECWQAAKLPTGVINLLQGGADVGKWLIENDSIKGVYFTGSSSVGYEIRKKSLEFADRIVALEMGGDNPLVVNKINDIEAAVYNTIQSAFITSGQRCTCARRLIVVRNTQNEKFITRLGEVIEQIKVGPYTDEPEAFMGPVISNQAAASLLQVYSMLVENGAEAIVPLQRIEPDISFLKPSLVDVTKVENIFDQEYFGPLLQLRWVQDFELALAEANRTRYGLAAGLFSDAIEDYKYFYPRVKAGIVNWNRPLTGASSAAPFGGVGLSGNYRPSAYYAADYCAYPVASLEAKELVLPENISPGIQLATKG